MDSNRDESERCIELALNLIKSNDKEKALKYLTKAERLFPSSEAKRLIEKITNECNNTRGSHSNSDYSEKNKTSDDYESEQQQEYDNSEDSKYNENTDNTNNGFNSNINSNSNTKTNPTNRSNTNTYSKCSTKEYSEEQLIAVKEIKKCKDYYEILGVTKETVDTDIKKQYRKLALQFHPDKNKAPGAAEAFKAIGNAFAILSDVEKRKQYDLYGSEEQQQRRRSHNSYYDNGYDYTRGFEGDVSADEIFNMFFGGGFPSGNVYVRRGNRWRETTRHQNHNQNQEVASGYNVLLQMMPVLVLLCLSLMSTFFVSDPAYSLSRTHKYSYERKTNNLEVPYFVKDNFERDYKGNIRRVEQQVEEDYLSNLRASCFRERNYKESMIWRARNFRDRELEERAKGLKTPSCDHLQKISSQYVIW